MSAGVYKKYVCKCGNWKRKPGVCKRCQTPLKAKGYGYTWKDANGKERHGSARNQSIAISERAAKLEEAKQGIYLAGNLTVEGLCNKWMETRGKKRRDLTRPKAALKNHLLPYFGKTTKAADVKKIHVEEYIASRDGHCAESTISLEVGLLKTIWRFGLDHKYVYEDVTRGITLKTQSAQVACPLSLEQEGKLYDGLAACGTKTYFQFLAYTGARRGEALALRWDDIDWDNAIAWVPGKSRKLKDEKQVLFLDDDTLEVLKTTPKITEFVFVNPRTKKPWNNPNSTLTALCKRLSIPHIRVHDLRHLYVSRMVQNGAELRAVSLLARHSDIRMTMRYAHLGQKHLRDALSKRKKPE